jgi:hypothetical protein
MEFYIDRKEVTRRRMVTSGEGGVGYGTEEKCDGALIVFITFYFLKVIT